MVGAASPAHRALRCSHRAAVPRGRFFHPYGVASLAMIVSMKRGLVPFVRTACRGE